MKEKEKEIDFEDLGLGTNESSNDNKIQKVEDATNRAAAAVALKAVAGVESELAQKEADKTYILEKRKYMLNKCKNDEQVPFVGNEIFADIFGKVYTFMYNTIPVTVRFDGSTQHFPKFIYDFLMKKISKVSKSNTNKDESIRLN